MKFLQLVVETPPKLKKNELSPASRHYLLRCAFAKLSKCLKRTDIHVVTKDQVNQLSMLQTYYRVLTELHENSGINNSAILDPLKPSLATESSSIDNQKTSDSASKTSSHLFSIFGGQGVAWLPELRTIFHTYVFTQSLIEEVAVVLQELIKDPSVASHFRHGLDLMGWLKESDPQSANLPNSFYLQSSPISFPLIGLTQLMQYYATLCIWNKEPFEIFPSFKGTTGHSQGIVAAVVFSLSKTRSELKENIIKGVKLLFWLGVRMQQVVPFRPTVSRTEILEESKKHGNLNPTPMLAVFHLTPSLVEKYVGVVNQSTSLSKTPEKLIEVAIKNSRTAVVVVGHPESLHTLAMLLHRTETPKHQKLDQSRVPFSKRKKEFTLKYLDVSVPFHSKIHLQTAVPLVLEDLQTSKDIDFKASDLQVPVYCTSQGKDLKTSSNLVEELVNLICVEYVDWIKATSKASLTEGVTHIIDFGPGQTSGIGTLTARNIEGSGVQVILGGSFQSVGPSIVDKSVLFLSMKEKIPFAPNWGQQFAPKLIQRKSDGKFLIETKFTRVLGKPPCMVAGMTPTTVNPNIVSACYNCGFHGELAGGGLPTEKAFRKAIETLVEQTSPGYGITLNLLFLNQRLWSFQFPLLMKLRQEGYPIEGICVAAGVPSPETASEIINSAKKYGLRHISFKPGSISAILSVIQIAKEHPDFNILLQWTGGRGGGHHSFEDFHEPIFQTYARIREHDNIILVGGSGFGDAQHSWPYLTGEWSEAFGFPKMPFDAILIASRAMVAKEANTAPEAKALLVRTPGIVLESEWEKSYDGNAGGVMTVLSELGEPIHKVATRGLELWRELDQQIFSLPGDKMIQKINEKKDYIIKRLNADFQKVYFGKKSDGKVVDLPEMTYAEVAYRMVELMYISETNSPRWIHVDFMNRVYEFALRTEERFVEKSFNKQNVTQVSKLPPISELESSPLAWVKAVFEEYYPQASTQLLCSEDIDYFVQLCKERGRKPVNFVPQIDKDLKFWFKKDSLWQSEDLEAVQDKDIGRVVILQGPLSVKYSNKVNEPIADILNGIHDGWIELMKKEQPKLTSNYSEVEFIGDINPQFSRLFNSFSTGFQTCPFQYIQFSHKIIEPTKTNPTQQTVVSLNLPKESVLLPDSKAWKWWLTQGKNPFWRALLTCDYVVCGKKWIANTVGTLFNPRPSQFIQLYLNKNEELIKVTVVDENSVSQGYVIQVQKEADNKGFSDQKFSVILCHSKPDIYQTFSKKGEVESSTLVPLKLDYIFVSDQPYAPIHDITSNRNERVKEFYSKLWLEETFLDSLNPQKTLLSIFEHEWKPSNLDVERFCRAVGMPLMEEKGIFKAPLDFAIVIAWESLIKTLFLKEIDGDILQLVHLSNSFKKYNLKEEFTHFKAEQKMITKAQIEEISIIDSGQKVSVIADIFEERNQDQPIVQVRSQFLFRGHIPFKSISFRRFKENRVVSLHSEEVIGITKSKKWISWTNEDLLKVGTFLHIEIEFMEEKSIKKFTRIFAKGTIKLSNQEEITGSFELVGEINYEIKEVQGNKILGFLERFGKPLEKSVFFQNGGYELLTEPDKIQAPDENNTYALASKDFNPIHTNTYFAQLADLPTTITHGMWTSANAHRVLASVAAKNDMKRVLQFSVEFVGMVKPKDQLATSLKHVGMKNGKMLIEVTTKNQNKEIVLKGKAEITSISTVYVFTGQGSAEKGMGMDLYESSSVSHQIWDIADDYFLNTYGFSILDIVKYNVKEFTIHFGGKKGETIRQNYQQLKQHVQIKEGQNLVTREQPLFPEITSTTSSYTFRHPEGLLFATQFSQPALVLVELAAFMDMKEKGLIPVDCIFAGHSLGEYAALASVASVIKTESLVDIVFLRGMTMQNAVIRDEKGRSPYAMVAVNPERVHPTRFRESELNNVIKQILELNDELLQVVNFNIENYQYVVAGERGNLRVLGDVLTEIQKDFSKLNNLKDIISKAIENTKQLSKIQYDGFVPLERGVATIPLPGIDVPFHSKFLKGGVSAFRYILERKIQSKSVNPSKLIGRYIPNLIAQPFSLEKRYVEEIYKLTNSEIMGEISSEYEKWISQPQELGYKILIELLAYQFASPVRWIETQHLLFGQMNIERLIEVGPAPTLATMADRTLQKGNYPLVHRQILWFNRDKSTIYYQIESVNNSTIEEDSAPVVSTTKPPINIPVPTPVQTAPVVPVANSSIPDVGPTSLEFLRVLISLRTKKPLGSFPDSTTIKQLAGGKSALQNELLGDLESEFQVSPPEDGIDQPLSKLGDILQTSYRKLGKVSSTLIHKLIGSKMPGGFGLTQVKGYLATKYGLGANKSDAILLHGVAMEPATRCSNEAQAQQWLDSVVVSYSQSSGQSILSNTSGTVQPASQVISMVPPSNSSAEPIPDTPLSALAAIRTLIAVKLKKKLQEVTPSTSIRQLVGGKSALQNEIVGDLAKELGTDLDQAAEMDIESLAKSGGSKYSKMGTILQGLVSKLIGSKMPGGFGMSAVKSYFTTKYGLGPGRIEGVLVHALTMEPASRFSSETESQTWLDSVFNDYCSSYNVSRSSSSRPSVPSGMMVVADSGALQSFRQEHEKLVKKQIEALQNFLGENSVITEQILLTQEEIRQNIEKELDLWSKEHGSTYYEGIKPLFDSKKERRFNSSWNWIRQDLLFLYYDYSCGRATNWNSEIRERLYHIKNRVTPKSLELVDYYIKKASQDGLSEITNFITILSSTLRSVINDFPKYREVKPPTGPTVIVTEDGGLEYREEKRLRIGEMGDYVSDLERAIDYLKNKETNSSNESDLWEKMKGHLLEKQVDANILSQLEKLAQPNQPSIPPYLFLRSSDPLDSSCYNYNQKLTWTYFSVLKQVAREGLSLVNKTVLITGCGKDSIGIELLKGLLRSGAKVYATTSRFSWQSSKLYQRVFDNDGAKQSELVVLPFNQASVQDINAIVDYIYDKEGSDVDFVIPFAAISETGMDIGEIGSKSELAHRIMLTNVIRLMGAIKNKKHERFIFTRPAHVLLPLSPNHGLFGYDGLYAESKLGLESLLKKWKSEEWSAYLSIAGAIIGWTRGTGLMASNNIVASGIEKLGVRTFNTQEMCFNLMCLLHPEMVKLAQSAPVLADLNGGLHAVSDLNEVLQEIRRSLQKEAALKKAITMDNKLDEELERGKLTFSEKKNLVTPKPNVTIEFPELPSKEKWEKLTKTLGGMLDLEKVIVITGFGEVGPYGNARTRWEIEAYGEFSLEGCIELAWMMGLIQYDTEKCGWVDSKTKQVVPSHEIKSIYEETLLNHTGIRLIEPDLFDGYDPLNKTFLHQVAINHDLNPIEVSEEEAKHFKQKHQDTVDIYSKNGVWYVKFKKGAMMYIPKALRFDRFVAGQIPSTWNPSILGIPDDIIRQVDRVTLFTLVSTVEALISSGITDPYEFYQYVHISEVGNTIGGGFGGMQSIRETHRNRFLDLPVQSDKLQEQFVNTVPAWINMLLLSCSGPIKTPVGACATAVESVEIGVETIRSGKAKIVIVGGYDDFGEEGSYEFAQMKATSNAKEEVESGREPREMSRPTTSTRSGFMESHGAGVQILMNAKLAIEMGAPIYGIVELVSTATDKEGRSVPAPGQGILTTAREVKTQFPSPLLNLDYRRRQLENDKKQIEAWLETEKAQIETFIQKYSSEQKLSESEIETLKKEQEALLQQEAKRKLQAALSVWGNDFYLNNPTIAPLRGALAVYGLTIDDLAVSSFHGTGTKANDLNECEVLQKQLEHLNRSKGNPVLSIFQKYLTGHPKGSAASWMLNGLIQSMHSGIIPGNRNADNIDEHLEKFDLVVFLNRSLHTYGYKAGLLKSFGFGQVGGEALLIHPDYVFSQLKEEEFVAYEIKRMARQNSSFRYLQNALTGKGKYVQVKNEPPYTPSEETVVYLNPLARASYNPQTQTWQFRSSKTGKFQNTTTNISNSNNNNNSPFSPSGRSVIPTAQKLLHKRSFSSSSLANLEVALREMGEGLRTSIDRGIGIDAQLISEIDDMYINNADFITRNFTESEIEYCRSRPDPSASFAGRWAAKEAVIKAISSCNTDSPSLWKGSGASLKEIEILPSTSAAPKVVLYGHALQVANLLGISYIKVAISHSGLYSIAQAIAR